MRYTVKTLFIAVVFASLGGCGQTGPLYMPPEPVPETAPETVPEPVQQPAAPADNAELPTQAP